MKDVVSIIIPVYKAEKYLRECVDSVISQTYADLEIILVDDGSPDSCPAICDEYALCDKRFKVIHKKNGGASSARNYGIEAATGKYICFVDSDDKLPTGSVELLVNSIVINKTDYAAGICSVKESGSFKNRIIEDSVIKFDSDVIELLKYITQGGSYSPYAKIYSADLIKSNNIRFDEKLLCSEDALFIRTYLRYCKSISLVSKVVYEYTASNEASLSKKRYTDYCNYYAEKMKALSMLCDTLSIDQRVKESFILERAVHGLYISISHYINHWENDDERKEYIKLSVDVLSPWLYKYKNADCNLNTIDKDTFNWWIKIRNLLEDKGFDNLYKFLLKNYNKKSLKHRLIRGIKKFF